MTQTSHLTAQAYFLVAFLTISASLLAAPLSHPVDTADYHLIWADEFEGSGRPDSSRWSFEHGFVRNHELQWYQEDNARIIDGILQIAGRRERVPNPDYKENSNNWKLNRMAAEYTSSCIKTRKSFSFMYGRLEVKARIPVATGAWPAIWTLGNQGGWPACGEIDVMEFYRVPPSTMGIHHDQASNERTLPIILANACWMGENGRDAWNTCRVPFTHFTERDKDWASRFHIWRMDWTPTSIKLYLDDELLNDIPTASATPSPSASGDTAARRNGHVRHERFNPFCNDREGFGHYILLNLAIGSSGGTPDDNAFPLVYEIDYVRVYQKARQ